MLSIILTFKRDVLRLVHARITAMLGDNNWTSGEASGPSAEPPSSNSTRQTRETTSERNGLRKREHDGDGDESREEEGNDRGKAIEGYGGDT